LGVVALDEDEAMLIQRREVADDRVGKPASTWNCQVRPV
jgi:hypothetical protein